MAKAAAAVEPSMEEILASIRRIISDDGVVPLAQASLDGGDVLDLDAPIDEADLNRIFAHSVPADTSTDGAWIEFPHDEPEELAPASAAVSPTVQPTEALMAENPEEPTPAETGRSRLAGIIAEDAIRPRLRAADIRPQAAAGEPEVSTATAAPQPPPAEAPPRATPEPESLVSDTTGASVNAAFGQLTHTILSNNARTLDDLVKEMLRPMLKHWLDENLPVVVERLVRAEIERVSRGR